MAVTMYCEMTPGPLGPLIRTAKEPSAAVTLSILGAAGSREVSWASACTLSGGGSLTDEDTVAESDTLGTTLGPTLSAMLGSTCGDADRVMEPHAAMHSTATTVRMCADALTIRDTKRLSLH